MRPGSEDQIGAGVHHGVRERAGVAASLAEMELRALRDARRRISRIPDAGVAALDERLA